MKYLHPLILVSLITLSTSQYLIISHPSDLAQTFRDHKIKVISSPIGFKPYIGSLHGRLALAQPLSACQQLQEIQLKQNQDIFMMADDVGCLQSVKANNIANTGAYIGIIKRNINNTLYDKQINLVHIPILEIQPNDYDNIIAYLKKNPNSNITLIADFNPQMNRKKINIELWLSPTQERAYQYILQFKNFIKNQIDKISFTPRYVLHSQTSRKQYIGCYSSGRYCPPDLQFEGRTEGGKVVGESLRQMIISANYQQKWFDYATYYLQRCLKTWSINLWQQQNSQLCSQNAMMSSGIDSQQIFKQFNKSFSGNRPEVDTNLYLQQQRQAYISQKITQYPILLVNGKQYQLEDPQQMKFRMCTMIHPDPNQQPPECQRITNPPVFTTGQIIVGIGILIAIMVMIMCVCKQVIYRKMKTEMRGEVDKTLSQYYRYMESFQQPDPHGTGKVPLVETKDSTQFGSVELPQIKTTK